jgi:hypothetical protein
MKYFVALVLTLSTFQYFSMAVISKGLTLVFLCLLPLSYILYRQFVISSLLKPEICLSLSLLIINIISLFINGGAIDSAIICIQFPLIFFLLSITSPLIFIKIKYTFDDLVANLTLVLFFSWTVFTLLGVFVLGDNLWWSDQGVRRLKGALGVAPSSILNSLICISSFYLFVFCKKNKFGVVMVASFIFVYLSGTRVSLVSCLFAIAVMLLFSDFRKKSLYVCLLVPSLSYLIYTKIFTRLVHAGGSFDGFESINFNGRLFLWDLLITDINNFYLGEGTGSSVELLKVHAVGVGVQPHNDYIRIIHDTGIIGLLIFITLLVTIMIKLMLKRNALYDNHKKAQYSFVLGLLVAFLSMMFTDNLYIYVFFFFPMLLYYFHIISVNPTIKGDTPCRT